MHRRRRASPSAAEAIRERISAGVITDRLLKHVTGEIEMTATQVAAGLGLLRKVVPDLAAIEHSGDVTVHAFAVPVLQAQPALTDASSEKDHTPATIDAPQWERITVQ